VRLRENIIKEASWTLRGGFGVNGPVNAGDWEVRKPSPGINASADLELCRELRVTA